MKIFLSYSRADQATADDLADRLEQKGFDVLIDRRDLPYGEKWQGELSEFIRTCDTVLWLVSPRSVSSKWCNWELGEATRLSKRLVPVVIEPVPPDEMPEALGAVQLLPRNGAFTAEQHLSFLVDALNLDRAWLRQYTQLADRAHQWSEAGKSSSYLLYGAGLKSAQAWLDRRRPTAPEITAEVLGLILASRRAAARRRVWYTAAPVIIVLASLIAYAGWMYARVTPLPDADLMAGDLDLADGDIGFESSLMKCRLSCLFGNTQPRCVAFSYDVTARKCYPKVEVGFYNRPSVDGGTPSYSELMPGIESPAPSEYVLTWDRRLSGEQVPSDRVRQTQTAAAATFIINVGQKAAIWRIGAGQCQRVCTELGQGCQGFNYWRGSCELFSSLAGLVKDPTSKLDLLVPGTLAMCRDKEACK